MNSRKLVSISAIALLLNSQQSSNYANAVSLQTTSQPNPMATPALGNANKTASPTQAQGSMIQKAGAAAQASQQQPQQKEQQSQKQQAIPVSQPSSKPTVVAEKKETSKNTPAPTPAQKPQPLQEPDYMKKYHLEQTVGTPEWKARQEELAEQARKESEQKQKNEDQQKAQKVASEKAKSQVDYDDTNDYDSDKIADYSKSLYSEKKMSSNKKQNNDYEIVTDGLDDDDEKQSQEQKVSAVQKNEPIPKPAPAALSESDKKMKQEIANKQEAVAKVAAQKREAEIKAANEKKAAEDKQKLQEQKEMEIAAKSGLKHMEEKKAGLNIEVDGLDDSFYEEGSSGSKEEKVVDKQPQKLQQLPTNNSAALKPEKQTVVAQQNQNKKPDVVKTAKMDYEIETSKISDKDKSKYVTELKIDKNTPEPPQFKKADEFKKKYEAEPDPKDQKKLKQTKQTAGPDFKIEIDTFDDGLVADHIRSEDKKVKTEKHELQDSEVSRKPGDSIKNSQDYNEEIISHMRDQDSSLRIEVSKLNDEEIDEQIEAHKESLRIAELRRNSAEAAAKRIKEEDDQDKKAALVEKKSDSKNSDFSISTDKLEDLETGEDKSVSKQQPQQQKSVAQVETAKPDDTFKNATKPASKKEMAQAPVMVNVTKKLDSMLEQQPKTAVITISDGKKAEAKPASKVESKSTAKSAETEKKDQKSQEKKDEKKEDKKAPAVSTDKKSFAQLVKGESHKNNKRHHHGHKHHHHND